MRKYSLILLWLIALNFTESKTLEAQSTETFYIGSYTGGGSEGIYRSALDINTGKLSSPVLVVKSNNPSFITFSQDGKYLLAVNETIDESGNKMGFIESFSVPADNHQLTRVSKVTSGGAHPCYVSVNKDGFVLAANYTGGSVSLIKMEEDGSLQSGDVKQHYGSGLDKKRQEAPHVHSALFEPGTNRIFVADLGTDAISVYHLDKSKSKLVKAPVPEIKLAPGSGPRHLAFHPKRKILYIANELSNSVSVVALNKNGSYNLIETVSALPEDYKKPNTCADIHISKDGRFLYVSNRGLNSIAIFAVSPKDGKLALIDQEITRGENPRNFTLSPDENYLLVANQTTDNILAFKRDKNSGKLTYTDQIKAFKPVCLLFGR